MFRIHVKLYDIFKTIAASIKKKLLRITFGKRPQGLLLESTHRETQYIVKSRHALHSLV